MKAIGHSHLDRSYIDTHLDRSKTDLSSHPKFTFRWLLDQIDLRSI